MFSMENQLKEDGKYIRDNHLVNKIVGKLDLHPSSLIHSFIGIHFYVRNELHSMLTNRSALTFTHKFNATNLGSPSIPYRWECGTPYQPSKPVKHRLHHNSPMDYTSI